MFSKWDIPTKRATLFQALCAASHGPIQPARIIRIKHRLVIHGSINVIAEKGTDRLPQTDRRVEGEWLAKWKGTFRHGVLIPFWLADVGKDPVGGKRSPTASL